jgi:hypothetical protein
MGKKHDQEFPTFQHYKKTFEWVFGVEMWKTPCLFLSLKHEKIFDEVTKLCVK